MIIKTSTRKKRKNVAPLTETKNIANLNQKDQNYQCYSSVNIPLLIIDINKNSTHIRETELHNLI